MNGAARALYAIGTFAVRIATQVGSGGDGKVARSLRARRGVLDRIRSKAAKARDPNRPLVWFHAPSVGEGLQAKPVIEALRRTRPDLQFAYTFYSPSAESFAATTGAELTEYLPFDGTREADTMLDALKPAALVFVKLDVWPVLVARARERKVPVVLLSATVSPDSTRLRDSSLMFTRGAYAAIDAIGAIDDDNAERLRRMGVQASRTRITGDTRYDQTWTRAERNPRASAATNAVLAPLVSVRPTLVAGSTWPSDESVLFPAWSAARASVPKARMIIAPHEPTPAHLEPIRAWAASQRLVVTLLSELAAPPAEAPDDATEPASPPPPERRPRTPRDPDVIIVDRLGVLGDLYALADVAYVGGGFHAAGLHSVLEPAAYGAPVLFGPGHRNSRDAGLLLQAHGARSVATAAELGIALSAWLRDPERRTTAGSKARAVVEAGLGATERSVEVVLGVIPRE